MALGKLTGFQRRNSDDVSYRYMLDEENLFSNAKKYGYTGDETGAIGYLYGARDASGNIIPARTMASGQFGGSDAFRTAYQKEIGQIDPSTFRGNNMQDLVDRLDPESSRMIGEYNAIANPDGFTLAPWHLLAMPLVAYAGMAAMGGAAGAGAGGVAAADAAGLAAMGTEAGLSGAALDAFVASGGTMGSTAAGGGGVLGAGMNGSSGMEEFFPDLMEQEFANADNLFGNIGESGYPGLTPGQGLDAAGFEKYLSNLVPNLGPNDIAKLAKTLLGGGGGEGGGLNLFGEGGLFDSGGANLLALAPSLAAINYAKNQSPFDTSRLESAYDSINPESLTREFDINTGIGRRDLTSSLDRRGVMGSSFANQDMVNFNTSRDLGRSSLLTSGAKTQADIGSQILNADIKEREIKNALYGRALMALSGGLMPRGAF